MTAMGREEFMERMRANVAWPQRLIVEPFFGLGDQPSAAASLDFHLGNRFALFRRRHDVQHDPVSSALHPEADPGISNSRATEEVFVAFGDSFILHPGHLVLGTTLEWFRFPLDLMAYVVGRSIWGRHGLVIATATAVQPGSSGTVTLELSNTGEIPIAIRPGTSIGQLFFHAVAPAEDGAATTSFTGALRPVTGSYSCTAEELFLFKREGLGSTRT